ncbi:MAG: ABC transporter ATP-binding protein [Chloroflexi bacterium]|nr:ABC transporter ATP-binding protein [Chloroflexota bacterium]
MMGGPGGVQRLFGQDTLKPKNTGATLARLAGYFKSWWPALLAVVVLMIIGTWTQVTAPELLGQAVDCYLSPQASTQAQIPGLSTGVKNNCWFTTVSTTRTTNDLLQGLGSLVLITIVLYLVGSITGGLQFFMMTWAGQHVLMKLRLDVFKHLHRLSLGYYAQNEVGNLMSRITNDTDALQQALSFALVNVTSGVLLIVWIAYKMLSLSLAYGLLSMAVVPFMFLATMWFSGQARKAFRRSRQEIGNVNADLQESIAGVREAQAFSRETENIASFRQVNAANRDANIRAVAFTSALAPVLEALGYIAIMIVTVAGGLALLRDQPLFGTVVSLGLIVTFLGYVQRFNQPIQQISVLWTNIQNAIAGSERIFGLLDTVPDVQDKPDARPMPHIKGRIVFDDVWAEYKPGEPVLRGINLVAEPGQTIAVVGPTGAGKTTLVNLIPRFYDVTKGLVTIDGIDVRDVSSASLRRQIGLVLQDTFLFSDTVINNIRYGRPEATDEEVTAAAKMARADQFIDRLPNGYNTVLGERGSGLSQGQRQLIAIARAILSNPALLILDEATSSVDTRTERLIQGALEQLMSNRTSFVIAHRLSTVRNADEVLVVLGGEIVERGRHEELLALKGRYYDLYMSQFRLEEEREPPARVAHVAPATS